MRFIHTADWHLGRIFHGMHLTDDQAYILENLELILKEEKPDAYIFQVIYTTDLSLRLKLLNC